MLPEGTEPEVRSSWTRALPLLLLPLLALLAILPLLLHGVSCGHDFDFHLQSWLDAAQQLRHGTLDPQWAFTPAWNAGEPRFIFYPPLSWLLGACLSMLLPFALVPAAFTWLALTGAALAMFRLARAFAPPPIALLASAVYIANPYMLFTAWERTAYAELLAAAWLPLLLLAALRRRPSLLRIALPVALLWLTNAPAAVIGSYLFALLIALRLMLHAPSLQRRFPRLHTSPSTSAARLLVLSATGLLSGLALAAFYVLPAALERRYVQITMAIIPNMRYQDNFLFGGTGDAAHDAVLRTASWICTLMLVLTALLLLVAALQRPPLQRPPLQRRPAHTPLPRVHSLVLVSIALCVLAFLLTPASAPIWHWLPELAYLQFPWRLLSVVGVLFSLALALTLSRWRFSLAIASILSAALIVAATAQANRTFRQSCDALALPSSRAQLFRTHHGVGATDEYTPTNADNDVLRWDDPPFWLAPQPDAFATGTVPNPAATIENYDAQPPLAQTISGRAPLYLQLTLAHPEDLILNLRAFPAWVVTRDGQRLLTIDRDDGLIAVALPSGPSHVDVTWHNPPARDAGEIISICAALALLFERMRSRRIVT